jgi:hypothetical protein
MVSFRIYFYFQTYVVTFNNVDYPKVLFTQCICLLESTVCTGILNFMLSQFYVNYFKCTYINFCTALNSTDIVRKKIGIFHFSMDSSKTNS